MMIAHYFKRSATLLPIQWPDYPWLTLTQRMQRYFPHARIVKTKPCWCKVQNSIPPKLGSHFLGQRCLKANAEIRFNLGKQLVFSISQWRVLRTLIQASIPHSLVQLPKGKRCYSTAQLSQTDFILNGSTGLGLSLDQLFFQMLNDFLQLGLSQSTCCIHQCHAIITLGSAMLMNFPRDFVLHY